MLSELREWWGESKRGLSPLKAFIALVSLGIPGIIRKYFDEALSLFSAIGATLPLTLAAAIIVYRVYRKKFIGPLTIIVSIVGTAMATLFLSLWIKGIGGGDALADAFANDPSLPEMIIRLLKIYWNLWHLSGMLSAIAVGWFLGWFWATRVVGYIEKRKGPREPQT